MTTLNEDQKNAIRLCMIAAWNNADYDHEQISVGVDFTTVWDALSHAKRMHLLAIARHLVKGLLDDEIIALVDDSRHEYEDCHFLDYEEGDWARVTNGNDVYEFLVTKATFGSIEGDSISMRLGPGLEFERAPKPVVIPDPEVHKYIVDHEDDDRIYEAKWDANYLEDRYYGTGSDVGVRPRLFTDWSAVKLVPVEEED